MDNTGPNWLLAKGAITLATATVVIFGAAVGLSGPLDVGSVGFTIVLLLPTIVFGFGVWSPRNVAVFGAILLCVTLFTWGLYLSHRKESMAGAGVVMGTIWALVAAILGAAFDHGDRRRP